MGMVCGEFSNTTETKISGEKPLETLEMRHIIIILLADDMFSQDPTSCVSCWMEQQRLCQLSR